MKYFPTTEKVTVTNYPYGRLQCEATFGLEFKQGKGFRTTFQTVNPKTGRLNAVKVSTYSPILLMYQADNGHIKYGHWDFYGDEGINRATLMMAENFDLFTPEQIAFIYKQLAFYLMATWKAGVTYSGCDQELSGVILKPLISLSLQGTKSGENIFNQIQIDIPTLKALDKPNFNPFVVTSHSVIDGSGMRDATKEEIAAW